MGTLKRERSRVALRGSANFEDTSSRVRWPGGRRARTEASTVTPLELGHPVCAKMAEAGLPEATMLALMAPISRAMRERYSRVRKAAKVEANGPRTWQDQGPPVPPSIETQIKQGQVS